MKYLYYLNIVLLLLALFHMPSVYYTILRTMVCGSSVFLFSKELQYNFGPWAVIFLFIALLFNPLLPIWLYNKQLWIVIDIVMVAILLIYRFKNLRNEEKINP